MSIVYFLVSFVGSTGIQNYGNGFVDLCTATNDVTDQE
jgi:hypothetical protein